MPYSARRSKLCERDPSQRGLVHFRFPQISVELVIRTILTRQWDDEAWPLVRQEFVKALAPQPTTSRKAGWWS